MRKNKRRKIVEFNGAFSMWSVDLPDGRHAELRVSSKKKALEQASAIFAVPVSWLQSNAKVQAIL